MSTSNTSRFKVLRLRYKIAFDVHRAIVARKAERLRNGHGSSEQEEADERRAMAELQSAREALVSATGHLDR